METKIEIREILEDYNIFEGVIKAGRYIASFYWQDGWHNVILGTPTEKQIEGYYLGKVKTKNIELNEIPKWQIPHLHKELRRQLIERGYI